MNILKYFKERKEKKKAEETRKAERKELINRALAGELTKEEMAAFKASFKTATCWNGDMSNWDLTKATQMPEGVFDNIKEWDTDKHENASVLVAGNGEADKPNDEDLISAARQLSWVFDFVELQGYPLQEGYKKNAVLIADRLESLVKENLMHEGQNLKLVFRNDDLREEVKQLKTQIKELKK